MVVLFISRPLHAQLSPGPLHRSHQALDGLRNCTQCHQIGSKDFQNNCLSCHSLLNAQINAGRGLHANEGFDQCQNCHSEHHGKDFELVHWKDGIENFDHSQTGYPLEAAHQKSKCRDCHQPANIAAPEILRNAGKDLTRTYLGLDANCLNCHFDTHKGQMDEDCLSCHDLKAWVPAPKFDHSKAAFQLLGAHARLECSQCHLAVAKVDNEILRQFKPEAHKQCLDCHQDTHAGTLSSDCLTCHSQDSWLPANGFRHDRTAYPLTGSHQKVACESCHQPQPLRTSVQHATKIFEGLAFATCANCHEDPHQTRLGKDCASCHTTDQWQAVNAKAFQHGQTRFPLQGKHQEVTCEACHLPGRPLAITKFQNCRDCHADEHQGQFQDWVQRGDCEACHSVAGFLPASFTIERHNQSFLLEGAHLAIPCIACHKVIGKPQYQAPTTHFKLGTLACKDCHGHTHGQNLVAQFGEDSCNTCHVVDSWSTIGFDHNTTEFPILGAHKSLTCEACHHESDSPGFFLNATEKACAACHQDPHLGQFSLKDGGTECEQCHANASWQAENFDHNRHAAFRLEGAHSKATCTSCHPQEQSENQVFTRFKPIAFACEDCHAKENSGGGL